MKIHRRPQKWMDVDRRPCASVGVRVRLVLFLTHGLSPLQAACRWASVVGAVVSCDLRSCDLRSCDLRSCDLGILVRATWYPEVTLEILVRATSLTKLAIQFVGGGAENRKKHFSLSVLPSFLYYHENNLKMKIPRDSHILNLFFLFFCFLPFPFFRNLVSLNLCFGVYRTQGESPKQSSKKRDCEKTEKPNKIRTPSLSLSNPRSKPDVFFFCA